MRKLFVSLTMVIFLMAGWTSAFAEGYFSIGGGTGGANDVSNLTFELGGVSTDRAQNRLIAIGLGIIFVDNNIPSGTLWYPCPHGYYDRLGARQGGPEFAVFGKYGLEAIKDKGLFIFGLGGFSFLEEIDLARSRATGWYYEQSSSSIVHGMIGVGLGYFPRNHRVSISAEYDNRRGITGSVGIRF